MNYDGTLETLSDIKNEIIMSCFNRQAKKLDALNNAISAIKTLQDMDKTMQKLIELTPSEVELLAIFLRTHSVSQIQAIVNYVSRETFQAEQMKLHSSNIYGKGVTDDFS